MVGIVDCNSFYCSCEKVFRPDLENKPVVVLSNNDGCVISRTDEARRAGIGMAVPYYQCRDLIREHGITVFSSNYYLYGDLSQRVMDTLRMLVNDDQHDRVEVYSVDEAFIDLSFVPEHELSAFSRHLKSTVEQWTGIRVSVGVAPTKVLSKMANRLAKKRPADTHGVLILSGESDTRKALEETAVDEIWGIGARYARKLRDHFGIQSAWQLRHLPETWAAKHLGGVTGVRLVRELAGEASITMKDPLEKKKMIATTRMFGAPVQEVDALKEAVATYIARAAEKLRRQFSAAGSVDVFVVTNGSTSEMYSYQPLTDHRYANFEVPTADTATMIAYALPLVDDLFRPGMKYLKAGIILGDIVPDTALQANCFSAVGRPGGNVLMDTLDNLNFSMRGDVVRYGATGTTRLWTMRQQKRSPRYTTRWEELYTIT